MKKFLSRVISVALVVAMMIPQTTIGVMADDGASVPFSVSLNGETLNTTFTDDGYTTTVDDVETTVGLYTIEVPEDTESVDLAFDESYAVNISDSDGGIVAEKISTEDITVCYIDATSNGEPDFIEILDPDDYELLYAITFDEIKNTTDTTYTISANGTELSNPMVTEDGYTYTDYNGNKTTVDLYTYVLPYGVSSVDLSFAYGRLVYNYDTDGMTWLDGWYTDYIAGSKTATCKVDSDNNGTPDIIQVQNTYNSDWSGAEVLYAITFKQLSTPVLKSAEGTSTSVKVTWGAVSGAAKYAVYYKEYGGSWKRAATTTSTSYTVTKLDASKTYYFTVRCLSSDGKYFTSDFNRTGIVRLGPVKPSVVNASTGVTVKWSAVKGAAGYYLYRKTGSGSYSLLTKLSASTTSYTDKTAVNGTSYTYAVRAYSGSIRGWFTGVATCRLSSISLTSLTNSAAGKATLKWGRNTKGTGYLIQYSTSSTFASGNKAATVTSASSASTVLSGLTKGKTYYVRIRAYKTVGSTKYYSAWSAAKSVKITK